MGGIVVIEVVGHSSALRMGFEMLRPWGVMSSVGVHNGESVHPGSVQRMSPMSIERNG